MTRLIAQTDGDRDLIVTRHFDAPRDKVWRALTDPALMRQWMTSDYGALKSLDGDTVVGGQQRFAWEGEDDDLVMTVTYDALEPPELIRHRESWPQHSVMENTVETRLIDRGDRTEMRMTITFASAEARDGAMGFGMAEGMEAMYAQLDTLLRDQTA